MQKAKQFEEIADAVWRKWIETRNDNFLRLMASLIWYDTGDFNCMITDAANAMAKFDAEGDFEKFLFISDISELGLFESDCW